MVDDRRYRAGCRNGNVRQVTSANPSLAAARASANREAAPALDIVGVAAMGIDFWRETYAWPISDAKFDRLADAVWDAFFDGVATLSGREQDVFKADVRLPGFLIQHIHLSAAAACLQHSSTRVPHGRQIAAHLAPDWNTVGAAFATLSTTTPRLYRAARSFGKNWILNSPSSLPSRFSACFGRADTWALGSRSPLRAAYQARAGTACWYLAPDDLPTAVGSPTAANLQRTVWSSLEKMNAAAQRLLDISLDMQRAASAWLRRLNDLGTLMATVDNLRKFPRHLLLTNLGQPTNRAIALAMRWHGVEVIGFHHGNDMGAQPFPSGDIVDLMVVDRFIVPSDACLRWRRESYARGRLGAVQPVRFERLSLPLYGEWLKTGDSAELPRRVETVMVVGYPPNWIRYPHMAAHWSLAQLDVEIALIKTLSCSGFKVLYKAHPEFEQETRGLFKDVACTVVGGHLESRWQMTDAFVFPRISSTSFGFALCTNRPVVLLDIESQNWLEEARELLASRCRMIPTRVEEGVRLRFDKNALITAMREAVSEPNQTFVKQAMCA
jgi:hypothetical protein